MLRIYLYTCVVAVLAGCTPAPEGVSVFDPYEAQNRRVHEFNKTLDGALFSSETTTSAEFPEEFATPIVNFADNVGLPGMVVNGILQADLDGAIENTVRFLINTTVGIGGLFDPATAVGVDEQETDFGETLAVWGVPEGAYLELPVLGPSTERALAGRIVDAVIDPLDRIGTGPQIEYGTAARILGRIVKRSQYSDTIDSVLRDSADSYAQQRLIYLQNRRFELGTTPVEDSVDPYDELYGDF